MAGIYIHIPFCKQACYYCDFHFSTSLKNKRELVTALCGELGLRKTAVTEPIETIYFGGGTPSLLSSEELTAIFQTIDKNYTVLPEAEITLEANPDDLTLEKIKTLANSPVNRLSIGIQSFFEEDLVWMNRSHNAKQALQAVQDAQKYFDNLSIDLIYGVPGMTLQKWEENLHRALELGVHHLSCYALTVEDRTALAKMIKLGKKQPVDEDLAKRHYLQLIATLTQAGYINYEFSNFGLPGYFSKNNTAYWFGKSYLGIGPAAHGFDGKDHRYWNVRNNVKYIRAIASETLPQTIEKLSLADQYNEYIMTRLRTIWGVSLAEIELKFGTVFLQHFQKEVIPLAEKKNVYLKDGCFHITPEAKFLGDRISADLFYVA